MKALLLAVTIVFTTQASWYGKECEGNYTASMELYNPDGITCASWDYPLHSILKVSHAGKSIFVRVNDRGPAKRLYKKGRKIDLSLGAFKKLADPRIGLIDVKVEPYIIPVKK